MKSIDELNNENIKLNNNYDLFVIHERNEYQEKYLDNLQHIGKEINYELYDHNMNKTNKMINKLKHLTRKCNIYDYIVLLAIILLSITLIILFFLVIIYY